MLKVIGLDHMVLRVPDREKAIKFFTEVLGMEGVRLEEWRAGKVPFPSVRINEGTLIDIEALKEEPGPEGRQRLAHFAVRVETVDAEKAAKELERMGVEVVPDSRRSKWGAYGMGMAFHVIGPGGVNIEIRQYDRVPA